MTDLGDILGLPAARLPARARVRCRACSHLVYADQLVFGMGRCCAEKHGLLVRRWRLASTNPAEALTLFDRPEDLMELDMQGTQPRVDVTGLNPAATHAKIVGHARIMIADESGEIAAEFPAGVTAATDDAFRGLIGILERHAPHTYAADTSCVRCFNHAATGRDHLIAWPCDDYRDAARGISTGLPEATQ